MQDGRKAVWSIPYVSVAAFFPSLKQNVIAYRSSKVSNCIFEIHQLRQSGFSRVYSNSWCSRSFEAEIIKIGPSSLKMYSNEILNFQESTTILNASTKKSLETYRIRDLKALFKRFESYVDQNKYESFPKRFDIVVSVFWLFIHFFIEKLWNIN